MPQKLTKEQAKTIATEFCSNGFKKGLALQAAGYTKKSSGQGNALRQFQNPLVKAELDAIVSRNADMCDVEVAEIVRGFLSIAFPAKDVHVNNSDRIAALAHLGKYKKMFVERLEIGIMDKPSDLSEDELALLREQAHALSRLKLAEPGQITGTVEQS